jgi:histidinol-phosphate aminotransferase
MDILSLARPNIIQLKPYSTARDEFKGVADIYLDANENPFPSLYHRYPDPMQIKLKDKIGDIKKIKAEQIFIGNGSDEAIDLLIRAFCEPGKDSILIAEPTYGMYSVCASINDVAVKKSLLTSQFQLNPDDLYSKIDSSLKLIFLCSPNNPSGNLLDKGIIMELLKQFKGIVVIDEAYIDFTDDEGFIPILSRFPNLVVMQTLSKAWGLAGLRLGMAFASEAIISILNKIKYPYNINSITQQIVLEQLDKEVEKNKQVKIIRQERERLVKRLIQLPFVQTVFPSDANFVLVRMVNAKYIYNYLMHHSIIVRDRSSVVLCQDCLRITIGTSLENDQLIEKLILYSESN